MDIYVANLAPETNEDDLTQLFSEFGEIISARIMRDRETGMSRGFGFVEMSDKYHAMDAIDNLDMTYFQGQIISVKQAKGKTTGGPGGGGQGNFNRPQRPRTGGFNSGGFNRSGDRPSYRDRNSNDNGNSDDRFNKRW